MKLVLALLLLILVGVGAMVMVKLLQHRKLRRQKAVELDNALLAYSVWIDQELQATILNSQAPGEPVPLRRVRMLKHANFPELAPQMVELLMAHTDLNERLWHLAIQRVKSADGLNSSDDVVALRGRVDAAVAVMRQRCAKIARGQPGGDTTTA